MAGKKKAGVYGWIEAEAEFIEKGTTYPTIAAKIGKSERTVERHASANDWVEKRRVFVGKVSGAVAAELAGPAVVRATAQALDYVAQHTNDWQTIRAAIMDCLEAEPDPLEKAKMASAVYKAMEAVQKGQRLSLGLDKKDDQQTEAAQQHADAVKALRDRRTD